MNAAIDQGASSGSANRADDAEEATVSGCSPTAAPNGRLPGRAAAGNDGLGLMLLGVSGDEVCPEVYGRKIKDDPRRVRGTVQADILKEDQAQNTCIFSTEFALR